MNATPAQPSASHEARPGWVYLVGAGPGDPGLLTLRGAELLASADVILFDELVDRSLLRHAAPGCECVAVGKRGSDSASKQAKQEHINGQLVALAQANKRVVRLKGGDPFLFGRGSEEAMALATAAVPFEVVPGVCSPLAASAYVGTPLTHRELASSVTFVTAVQRDGKPYDWGRLSGIGGTLCVFMGRRSLRTIGRGLIIDGGWAPSTPALLAQAISTPRQQVVEGDLSDIAERAAVANIGTPSLLIVGQSASLREPLRWFERQPLFGKRVLLTRPAHQAPATAALLRRRGAAPLMVPTIAIHDPADPAAVSRAIDRLDEYRMLVFTSRNGVDRFWRSLRQQGRDARAFGKALVAAIGPATAEALTTFGIVADIVAETFVAEDLVRAILPQLQAGERVLVPRAEVAREVLPESLRAAGLTVDVVPVYRTLPVEHDASALRAQVASADIVLLTSSSTVETLCAALGPAAADALAHCTIASIGPITSATAQRLGLDVAVSAQVSTLPGLVSELEEWLSGTL